MKHFRGLGITILLASIIQGCSTLPDTSDMTGVDVLDIMKNVRCELKDTITEYPESHPINRSAIALTFIFTATENNDADGAADFTVPIAHGVFKIGFDAKAERQRQGEKNIQVSELIGDVRKLDCSDVHRTESRHYPILGHVGIADVIRRYATLLDDRGVLIGNFSDELDFSLTYTGGIRSTATIVPLSGHDRSFSLNASASREDKHKLLLTISQPAPRPPAKVEIVNLSDFQPVIVQTGPSAPAPTGPRSFEAPSPGGVVPSARTAPPTVRRAPSIDPRERALRDSDFQQGLKIQQQILDDLRLR